MITSSQRRNVRATTQLLISVDADTTKTTRLRFDSLIQCENLVTDKPSRILKVMGQLSADFLLKVDDCLKAAFGI